LHLDGPRRILGEERAAARRRAHDDEPPVALGALRGDELLLAEALDEAARVRLVERERLGERADGDALGRARDDVERPDLRAREAEPRLEGRRLRPDRVEDAPEVDERPRASSGGASVMRESVTSELG